MGFILKAPLTMIKEFNNVLIQYIIITATDPNFYPSYVEILKLSIYLVLTPSVYLTWTGVLFEKKNYFSAYCVNFLLFLGSIIAEKVKNHPHFPNGIMSSFGVLFAAMTGTILGLPQFLTYTLPLKERFLEVNVISTAIVTIICSAILVTNVFVALLNSARNRGVCVFCLLIAVLCFAMKYIDKPFSLEPPLSREQRIDFLYRLVHGFNAAVYLFFFCSLTL